MNGNDLNRALVLEEAQRVPDGAGGCVETWTPLGTLWACVRAGFGRESRGAGGALSKTGFRITVRAAPFGMPSRPRAGQRFRDKTRVFQIQSVAEKQPGDRFLTCFCEEEMAV